MHVRCLRELKIPILVLAIALASLFIMHFRLAAADTLAEASPTPLLSKGHPVEWWFVFKLNAKAFPGCGERTVKQSCPFGGTVKTGRKFGQQFVYASNKHPGLQKGNDCVGDATTDPVGATFDEVYNGHFHYLIWNDQFYGDPRIKGCGSNCGGPWGHSKGLLAWNDKGAGFVMQVSTPSWPASGSREYPRPGDGNTLGCISDNNVMASQHFFAVTLNESDLVEILRALQTASVATDPHNLQIVNNGGPSEVQTLVNSLGHRSRTKKLLKETLSSGITVISKPSSLHVPPWQMVSAVLGGIPLRTATWWARPKIPSTSANTRIGCWDPSLEGSGPVAVATSGTLQNILKAAPIQDFSLVGSPSPNSNHAKFGVAITAHVHDAIFGDLNQQGALAPGAAYEGQKCSSSQNGRGGLFYVMNNPILANDLCKLMGGTTGTNDTACEPSTTDSTKVHHPAETKETAAH